MVTRKKFFFKKVTKNDLSIIQKWRNSPEIRDFNTQFAPLNSFNQKQWHEKISQKNSNRIMFMILDNLRKPIGICGLIHIDKKNRNADVAIILGDTKLHGQGYGTESLKLLVKYGFEKLKLHRIGAEIIEYNKISIKLFEKLNFKYEVLMKENLWRNGKWWNTMVYSILAKN